MRIGKISIPIPIVLLFLIPAVLAATLYAEMNIYLNIRPKPVPVFLTPTYVSMEVYAASIFEQLATIENDVEDMTFEIITDIYGNYYDIADNNFEILPYLHVTYLDYETGAPLPDTDSDGNPEIFSGIGTTMFYIQIIIDDIPDLRYGYASINIDLTEFA